MDYKGLVEEEILDDLLKRFFRKRHIQETLKFIEKQELTGCEKWFQVELLKYLFETDQIVDDDIVKEETYQQDKRKDEYRKLQRIDLTFRIKHKQFYIALELKHKNWLALADIEEDLNKLESSKPSEKDYFRKGFALLIHPASNEKDVIQKAEDKEFDGKIEFSRLIPETGLSYTVFSRDF